MRATKFQNFLESGVESEVFSLDYCFIFWTIFGSRITFVSIFQESVESVFFSSPLTWHLRKDLLFFTFMRTSKWFSMSFFLQFSMNFSWMMFPLCAKCEIFVAENSSLKWWKKSYFMTFMTREKRVQLWVEMIKLRNFQFSLVSKNKKCDFKILKEKFKSRLTYFSFFHAVKNKMKIIFLRKNQTNAITI